MELGFRRVHAAAHSPSLWMPPSLALVVLKVGEEAVAKQAQTVGEGIVRRRIGVLLEIGGVLPHET